MKVYKALAEDVEAPHIWSNAEIVHNNRRSHYFRVVHHDAHSGRKTTVYCPVNYAGPCFIRRFNERRKFKLSVPSDGKGPKNNQEDEFVIMSEYWRTQLGDVTPGENANVEIHPVPTILRPWAYVRASWHHPEQSIFLSTILAILSFLLGIVSCGISISS